ncbi:hypothetical protein [Pseudomonas sp. IT-P294]|uniref:hypothetical protein n=1 Tax=Pseudomonas sp. IT-P294 TaxID=3026454 RepID=UPI0039E1371B
MTMILRSAVLLARTLGAGKPLPSMRPAFFEQLDGFFVSLHPIVKAIRGILFSEGWRSGKGFIAFATGRRTDTAGLIDGRQNTVTEAILIVGKRNKSRLLPINNGGVPCR